MRTLIAALVAGLSALTVAPAAAADAAFPRHVYDMAYYGLNGVNAAVPPVWMAEHIDIVEDDGFTAPHATAFKRAGGRTALAYTDPTYVPHCAPPFRPPAGRCDGPIGNLVNADESAWLHDARGERIRRDNGAYFGFQEMLNPAALTARRAYARTTAEILAHAPLLDGFEADDSGSPLASQWYGFSGTATELRDDAQFIAAESAMLQAAGKPVLINGGDPDTWGPAYDGRFLDLPWVMGQQFEGCFNNGGHYLYTEQENKFARVIDGMLAVARHRKLAVCYPTGDTSPAHRLYAYASWLLAYDERYSVFDMEVRQADGLALYPETELVPRRPLATATRAAELQRDGMYVRQFGACAIAGTPVGACATVVNPTAHAVAMPRFAAAYRGQVALDAQSLYHGGRARIVSGVPAQLAAATAAIVVR